MTKFWDNIKKYAFSEGEYDIQASENVSAKPLSKKDTLSFLTWNIGYCCLGAKTDWVFEGGKRLIIASKDEVMDYMNGIIKTLKKNKTDIVLLQEIPKRSLVSYYTNPLSRIMGVFKKYSYHFVPKLYIKSILFQTNIGTATLSKFKVKSAEAPELHVENLHVLRKNLKHHLMITHYPIENSRKQLIVINLHLPAFDKKGKIREKHLQTIKEKILSYEKEGHYVICGGDWNYILHDTTFKHSSQKKFTKQILPFPDFFAPKHWKWGVDPKYPTMRTLDHPYKKGKNYTNISDGFFVSPNVLIQQTKTLDVDFAHSDHNPVLMDVKLK